MQRIALNCALSKAGRRQDDLDLLFAGDLLNQCVGSAYGLLDFRVPYCGLYGACSTAAEGLLLASLLVSGPYTRCAVVTSSHYCSAERQYRTPVEYGGQRTPTAQWTVTGAGAFLVEQTGPVRVAGVLPRLVKDAGIRDASNMGAAMAPAAAETLLRYFAETGESPLAYDRIVTGDLGKEGLSILGTLLRAHHLNLDDQLDDCGVRIFDPERQDAHAGGSGCGCSATVLAAHWFPKLARGEIRRMLLIGTGAMMSPASLQQGESIPGIAHLLCLEHNPHVSPAQSP